MGRFGDIDKRKVARKGIGHPISRRWFLWIFVLYDKHFSDIQIICWVYFYILPSYPDGKENPSFFVSFESGICLSYYRLAQDLTKVSQIKTEPWVAMAQYCTCTSRRTRAVYFAQKVSEISHLFLSLVRFQFRFSLYFFSISFIW